MKKILFFYIVFLFPSIFFAQDVTGVWQGYVERSNPDCPSFPQTFLVTFILEQDGNLVTGTSRSIEEGTPYFGFYELNGGNLNNNILLFGADLVQDLAPPGSAWCDGVIGELEYNEAENLLEGFVSNVTGSACCDGDLYLKRLGLLSDSIQCQGELVELEVTGENVQWYADENLDSLLGTGNTLEVIINELTSFYITQSFVGEETSAIQIDIDVYEQQITAYEIIITNACNDNNGTIEVLLDNDIDALFQINDNDFSTNNILDGLSPENYSLTIQDENGCQVDTSFQIINEECEIKIPNAFTPDGDGINDNFGVVALYDFRGQINLFKVFNRWGEKVIDLQNQNIEDAVWDGKKNNQALTSDVYVYLIEIEYASGRREIFSGDITLIR